MKLRWHNFSFQERITTPVFLESTGRPPPVVFSCDKMTEKRRSGQMLAVGSLFPHASAEDMVKTFFAKNSVVRAHDAVGLATSLTTELKQILKQQNIPSQLIGGGVDGQYILLGVLNHLTNQLRLLKPFYSWDPTHRLNLADKDVANLHLFFTIFVGQIKEFLADVKYGKKYEHLIQVSERYADEKFFKLHSISATRFAGYFFQVK
jgi:hypothetical protein